MPASKFPPFRRAVICVVLWLLVSGCGEEEVATPQTGVRVRILTSELDGPVEGRLQLRALEEGDDKLYDLEAVPGEPDLHVAAGAPEGMYAVFSTADWGMLWGGKSSPAPRLRSADHPATLVRMGRPRTLYVAAKDARYWQVSASWGVEVKAATAGDAVPFERVPIEIQLQPDRIASLTVAPEHWRVNHVLRFVGLMASGVPTKVLSFAIADKPRPYLPRLAFVDAAPQVLFQVHLVPPPGVDQVADGTPVGIRLLGVPLDMDAQVLSKGGTARFDGLAALGGGLRISLPKSGPHAVYELSAEERRLQGEMWVVATPPDALARWSGQGASESDVVEARVLYSAGEAFGRVPLARSDDDGDGRYSIDVHTLRGDQEWVLRHEDGRWSHQQVHIPPEGAEMPMTRVQPVAQGAGCNVRGSVKGAAEGFRVLFRLLVKGQFALQRPILFERLEGGGGFVAAVSPQGEYQATLPPGTYEIRVVGPTGGQSKPRTMDLRSGTQLRMDLSVR